ncbi:MAG: hypothetical protein SFU25_06020 [Candidatus Caenarcaniphilales bacterium]|nr:hypothetical protein [Candidatus Caenarcaniphilales bacterium]
MYFPKSNLIWLDDSYNKELFNYHKYKKLVIVVPEGFDEETFVRTAYALPAELHLERVSKETKSINKIHCGNQNFILSFWKIG